jgi:indole-3-glycerol phosphate synthase
MPFLEEILPEIRRAVTDPRYGTGLPRAPTHSRSSLREALRATRAGGSLVVEYKRVSPGQKEPVLPFRTVAEFVETTRPWASAYSCLATPPRFRGSPNDVAELVRATDRPVLFKDIVVDPRQVEVAARTGASAVLLIARLFGGTGLPTRQLASLAETAHRLGLEVVLEFHHRSELSRCADVAAEVYGVNARDLDTLAIDRPTAEATLRDADARGLHPLLGLSGVEGAADARRFWDHGADGILVGTSIARASDPARFLSELVRPSPKEFA